ncbi:hypothetical protein D3C87_1709300 [compost metagenome]
MQVRQRLAHREGQLVDVELAPEDHANDVVRMARLLGTGGQRLGQAVHMVLLQLADAGVQVAERAAVRRQDQHVGGQVFVLVQ